MAGPLPHWCEQTCVVCPAQQGHYLTVVAYEGDGEKVKITDPWQPVGGGTYWMDVEELANWAASRGCSA